MDEYMVVVRLIHIFAGIVWVGSAWFFTFLLSPAARALGKDGQDFMRRFFAQSRVVAMMPAASLLTVASGLLLYYRISDHFNSDWMHSAAGVVLSIGAVAGLGEFIFGSSVIGPTSKRLADLGKQLEGQGGPPSEAQLGTLNRLQSRMGRLEVISTALTVVSVAGMAAARYM